MTEHDTTHDGEIYRAGFACLVGRPNAGKSTLTNALVGAKIAITSAKPQTTRHTIRGIVSRPGSQLILVDTPGLHKPRTLLGERLNDLVKTTWAEVDVVAVCFPANEKPGPGRGLEHELVEHQSAGPCGKPGQPRRRCKLLPFDLLVAAVGLGRKPGFERAEEPFRLVDWGREQDLIR